MNDNTFELTRQEPTSGEMLAPTTPDPSQFTMTVADALQEFLGHGCSTTERTIQRYCHNAKLNALRVNPDSRQVTDVEPYIFLIHPASVEERIKVVKEQQEFSRPTVFASSHDPSRPAVTMSDRDATVSDSDAEKAEPEQTNRVAELEQQVRSLEIDKAVRDKMVEQLQDDRKLLFGQLEGHVQTMNAQSRELGSLEAQLKLAASANAEPDEENGITSAIADESPAVEMNTPSYSDERFRV